MSLVLSLPLKSPKLLSNSFVGIALMLNTWIFLVSRRKMILPLLASTLGLIQSDLSCLPRMLGLLCKDWRKLNPFLGSRMKWKTSSRLCLACPSLIPNTPCTTIVLSSWILMPEMSFALLHCTLLLPLPLLLLLLLFLVPLVAPSLAMDVVLRAMV